jgi:predicted  nucleic acid-binding Zn-ribbon protein
MAQMRQDPRSRRISELEAEVAELREKLAQSERSLVELGLRLSQENEALKKELAAVLQGQENIGPRMNRDEHE